MLPLPSPLGLSDMGPGVWLQVTDAEARRRLVVEALRLRSNDLSNHAAKAIGQGDGAAFQLLVSARDNLRDTARWLEDGDLLLVGREQLEWVRLWVLHGEVEQPCPTCGIPMPVNPDCGWICGNRDCHQPGQPFGIQPYEILNLILGPSPEPNGVKP
jgi:hypothetical protein